MISGNPSLKPSAGNMFAPETPERGVGFKVGEVMVVMHFVCSEHGYARRVIKNFYHKECNPNERWINGQPLPN